MGAMIVRWIRRMGSWAAERRARRALLRAIEQAVGAR
jgi:hypothetical protein